MLHIYRLHVYLKMFSAVYVTLPCSEFPSLKTMYIHYIKSNTTHSHSANLSNKLCEEIFTLEYSY